MLTRTAAAARALPRQTPTTTAQLVVARRGFQTSRARLSSPYHYPEGPLSNLPFNPRKKGFAIRYWAFCATGFGLPFAIAVWQTYHPAKA
ncbi:hypothetical protein VTK56DRAFT_9918 [Thermocarpiscus australiensis]